MKTITASAASKSFTQYLDAAQHEPVVITQKNHPVAVTLSIQDAHDLLQYQIEVGVQKGLDDVAASRVTPMTPEHTSHRVSTFKKRLATG